MKNVIFLPPAEREMIESALYYEEQAKHLGYDFLTEVQKTTKFISQFPTTWPIVEEDIRKCLVNRFPYGIFFRIKKDLIVIVAIANLHKKPGYWKNRL